MVRGKTRFLFRQFHLYVGLCFGGIFVLSGLTGSAIVWLHELDSLLNPDLFHVSAPEVIREDAVLITPVKVQKIFERLAADPQYGRPAQITLPEHASEVIIAWYRMEKSDKASLLAAETSRQVMINPYTLQITGERNWGEIGVSRRLLMPTLFHVHRYLLAGEPGKTVIGISGLVLFITSIAGVVLWWPKHNNKALRQAFTISHRGSWSRFHYSFHRTAGFFVAPVLIVLGFSGWYFNMPKWVTPIVSSVVPVSASDIQLNRAPVRGTPITPGQAMQAAQALYPNARITRIALPGKASAPYEVRLRQPGEVRQGHGATRITFDAYNQDVLRVRDPMRAPAGDTFLNWLFPLHNGEAFGMAGRIFIFCMGIMPLLLLITGLGFWLKRKTLRTH